MWCLFELETMQTRCIITISLIWCRWVAEDPEDPRYRALQLKQNSATCSQHSKTLKYEVPLGSENYKCWKMPRNWYMEMQWEFRTQFKDFHCISESLQYKIWKKKNSRFESRILCVGVFWVREQEYRVLFCVCGE